MTSAHLAAALPVEPDGLAAKALVTAGITGERLYAAVGAGPAQPPESASPAELLELTLDESAKEALKATLKAALRLGHNYIGTEHMLLGLCRRGPSRRVHRPACGTGPSRSSQEIAPGPQAGA